MKANRALIAAAYLIAALLIVTPLTEAALAILPVRSDSATWRFGATGLLSRALMTPVLGLLLASGIALALDHRRVLRTLAVLAGIAAIALLAGTGLFSLDALEVRARVRLDARAEFHVASIQALFKVGGALTAVALIAVGDWRASSARRLPRATTSVATVFGSALTQRVAGAHSLNANLITSTLEE